MADARRRSASWTVVGDAGTERWPDAVGRSAREAFGTAERRAFHMTTNYRNARRVFDYAAEVIRAHVPRRRHPARSARDRRPGPGPLGAGPHGARSMTTRHPHRWSTVVAIVAESVDDLLDESRDRSRSSAPTRTSQPCSSSVLGATATVLDPLSAKGLEFDATVVVDPAGVVSATAGRPFLYVALTSSAHRMTVVTF